MSELLISNLLDGGVDVVFLSPSNLEGIYQNLANDYAAIEPPTWALLLAQSVRSQGFKTAIIDASAEQLTDDQILVRITELNPRLVCFVVYGQNVNAGTAVCLVQSEPQII